MLIVVLILNTFYWLNLIAQIAPEYKPIKTIPTKKIDWKKVIEKRGEEYKPEEREKYTFSERLSISLGKYRELSKGIITLLAITDAVLMAISFMIILLYKKSNIRKRRIW